MVNNQNNYIGAQHMNNAAKTFDILAISLNISQNYFNNPTNLFLDLHRIKL